MDESSNIGDRRRIVHENTFKLGVCDAPYYKSKKIFNTVWGHGWIYSSYFLDNIFADLQ